MDTIGSNSQDLQSSGVYGFHAQFRLFPRIHTRTSSPRYPGTCYGEELSLANVVLPLPLCVARYSTNTLVLLL